MIIGPMMDGGWARMMHYDDVESFVGATFCCVDWVQAHRKNQEPQQQQQQQQAGSTT